MVNKMEENKSITQAYLNEMEKSSKILRFVILSAGAAFIIFLGFLMCLAYQQTHKNSYDLRIIELDNNNFYEKIKVIDYICSDGIKVNNIQNPIANIHSFYASAWTDAKAHKGKCALKIKED